MKHEIQAPKLLTASLALILFVGCSANAPPENSDEPAGEAETADTTTIESALPPPVEIPGGDDLCEPPYPTFEPPHLETWLAASTAVIVGTVDRVEVVDDPVVVSNFTLDDDGNGHTWYEFGSRSDCDPDLRLRLRADIHLTDVVTLDGQPMPKTLTIRVRLSQWSMHIEEAPDGSAQFVENFSSEDVDGVFPPGSRIGGGVVLSPVTGHLTFEFRMFEVIDGTLHLQEFSDDVERQLRDGPDTKCADGVTARPMMLDFAYNGVPWQTFANTVRNATYDVQSLRQRNTTLDRFLRLQFDEAVDEGPRSYYQHLPTCQGQSDVPEEEDPAVKNDPDG